MDDTELFILFPRYEDCSKQQFYVKEVGILPEEELKKYIEKIRNIKDFFTYEVFRGYYDVDNVKDFVYPTQVDRDFYPNIKTSLQLALRGCFENWRSNKKQDAESGFLLNYTEVKDDTLCEIVSRKRQNEGSMFLLIDCDALEDGYKKNIRLTDKTGECLIEVGDTEIKHIAAWLADNRRPQRLFNCIPKHGENGKGAFAEHKGDKVSVLLCSRQEAEELLKKATGEEIDRLYSFDDKNKCYIEFKKEHDNEYHGYHLDDEESKKLSKQIKEKMNIIK